MEEVEEIKIDGRDSIDRREKSLMDEKKISKGKKKERKKIIKEHTIYDMKD